MADGFVNPYNFIAFPKEKSKAYTDKDRHTGYIRYTITTKSPLFIPNSSSDTAFKDSDEVKGHKSYDFFSYTNLDTSKRYENEYHTPVIPGSEMRGVVRSVYETLTDSCMGMLNEEEYPVKRSYEKFNPGLLHRDKQGRYRLYPAQSFMIDTGKVRDMNDGAVIWFEQPDLKPNGRGQYFPIANFDSKHKNGYEQGYLIKWGMGVRKSHYHVFKKTSRELDIDVQEKDIGRALYGVIDSYLEQPTIQKGNDGEDAYKAYRKAVENFLSKKEEAFFPVTYSIIVKKLYLAPAIYSKEISTISIKDVAGKFAPCATSERSDDHYCPACALFGYIGAGDVGGKGSRIRFADLRVEEKKSPESYYACDKMTIPELGGPKLGNVDFYLKRPEGADFWTYDYYVKGGRVILKPGELRGRKFYWHHQSVDVNKIRLEPQNRNNRNKTIRPVKSGVSFTGELYYEGISYKQLKQLVWILNCGNAKYENSNARLGLKLGGAKPFGFGSVSCTVDEVCERSIDIDAAGNLNYLTKNMSVDLQCCYEQAGFSSDAKVKEGFKLIAGLESVPVDRQITYPRMLNQKDDKSLDKGFLWFGQNHLTRQKNNTYKPGGMPNNRVNAKIRKELPALTDSEGKPQLPLLDYYVKEGTGKGGSQGYKGTGSGRNGSWQGSNGTKYKKNKNFKGYNGSNQNNNKGYQGKKVQIKK